MLPLAAVTMPDPTSDVEAVLTSFGGVAVAIFIAAVTIYAGLRLVRLGMSKIRTITNN